MVVKPTVEEIRQAYMELEGGGDDFEFVNEEADPSWRHGCYMTTVYKRLSDQTYWSVNWQLSGDGEYNSIRDKEISDMDIYQVEPYEQVITSYRAVKVQQ
jgi:hypothetical protein